MRERAGVREPCLRVCLCWELYFRVVGLHVHERDVFTAGQQDTSGR